MKKRDRMMAMALAAVVTATSMPTVAFAEDTAPSENGGGTTTTTSNSDGSTTTTTSNADGSSSSTTTNADGSSSVTNTSAPASSEPSPGKTSTVTVTTTVTYSADGVQTGESTTKETVDTEKRETGNEDGSVTKVDNTDTKTETEGTDTSNGGTTTTESTENTWDHSTETSKTEDAPDNNTPGEPTGTGFADENSSETDQFVSDFQEGTTVTDSKMEGGNEYSESMKQTDAQGRPIAENGYAGGGGGTTEEHSVSERTETEISRTEGEFTESETQPEDEQVEGEAFTQDGETQKGEGIPSTDIPLDSDAPLTGTVDPANTTATVTQDMTGLYNEMLAGKHNEVKDAAAAEAGKCDTEGYTAVADENGNAVSHSQNDAGDDVYTSTFTNENGDTITKEVTVKKVTDGTNVSFTTTTTLTTTPANYDEDYTGTGLAEEDKYFADPEFTKPIEKETAEDGTVKYFYMDGENKVYLNTADGQSLYDYAYGELQETDTEPVITYTLPERPAPQDDTEPDADGHLRKYTVEDVYDEQGNLYGYRTITTIYNAAGEVIGGGESYLMGEKTVTETKKEVEKTTTIDIYKQTTEVTERTVTKTVTESVVNYTLDDAARDLVVNWLSSGAGENHGDLEELLNNIIPSQDLYEYDSISEYKAQDLASWLSWQTDSDGATLTSGQMELIGTALASIFLVADSDGVTHYVKQYKLEDNNKNDFYAYCMEFGQALDWDGAYVMENLNEVDYIGGDEAKENIRKVVYNGFWGTEEGVGSMANFKQMLLDAGGWTQAEVDAITAGQAMTATQAAIWHYGNDGDLNLEDVYYDNGTAYAESDVDTEKKQIVYQDMYKSGNSTLVTDYEYSDNLIVTKIYNTLLGLDNVEDATTELIDADDLTAASITAAGKVTGEALDTMVESLGVTEEQAAVLKETIKAANEDNDSTNDIYDTNVSFTMAVVPTANDSLTVIVQSSDGAVYTKNLNTMTPDDNGTYTINNIPLRENVTINLSIDGTQNLQNGVYVYRSAAFDTSDTTQAHSQTMVGMATGTVKRTVELDMNLSFNVDEADAQMDGSSNTSNYSRKDRNVSKTNLEKHDEIVTALVEVTKTETLFTSEEWYEEYEDTWSYGGGGGNNDNDDEEEDDDDDERIDIFEDDVPLADDPGMVLGEEEPMVLGEEEEPMLIAATGDSNHMTAGFGGMFAALAGMFFLRKKKEN